MAACAQSKGGAVLFAATTDTYTAPNGAPILIRGITISGGSAAGIITLKEGWDGTVADASGGIVAQGYLGIGQQQTMDFNIPQPFIANSGLKCSALTVGAYVLVYLA